VHACSSGGTQAGLAAGLALHGLATPVIGSAPTTRPTAVLATVGATIAGIGELLGREGPDVAACCRIEVRDDCVGEGYGIPTAASLEAQALGRPHRGDLRRPHLHRESARRPDRHGANRALPFDQTVLFWHTGGQVGLFT